MDSFNSIDALFSQSETEFSTDFLEPCELRSASASDALAMPESDVLVDSDHYGSGEQVTWCTIV